MEPFNLGPAMKPQQPASNASSPSDTSMVSDSFAVNGPKLKEVEHGGIMVNTFTYPKQILCTCAKVPFICVHVANLALDQHAGNSR